MIVTAFVGIVSPVRKPIGTYGRLSDDVAGTIIYVEGFFVSLNKVGLSASFLRPGSGAAKRFSRQAATLSITLGIFRNSEGETPTTLMDFFKKDFLLIIDESHVTVPQVRGMYNGDRARKQSLVDYGFRLPSALDNRPLKFNEFEEKTDKVIYISATPGDYELEKNPKTVKELVNTTNITYSSISSNLVKLEERNYVIKKKNKYHLKPLSKIYYRNLMDFKMSVDLITTFDDFWGRHNIDQLTLDSIQNINDLKDSELIKTTPLDIYKTHNTIKEKMITSKSLKAIFPYLHPEYPQLIENILKNNGKVEIVLPRNMFSKMILEINEDIRKPATAKGDLKVYTTSKELNLYLTLCDDTMSLGLFKNDGSFDQNRLLISSSEKSQKWANNLFTSIKEKM